MKKLSFVAAALVALGGAGQAHAALIETPTVARSATIGAGAPRSLTLSCPDTAVAVSGWVTSGFGTLRESLPRRGTTSWTFRFASASGPRRVTALLRCVRMTPPAGFGGVRLVVGSAFQSATDVKPGATERLRIDCPRGQFPTGWGLERSESLALLAAVPGARSWLFKVENTGSAPGAVTARVRCLARRQRAANGQTHSFASRTSDGRSCRRDESSLATGVSLDSADDTLLTGTHPVGERGGRWNVRGSGSVRTMLLCLARDTLFH